MNGIVIPVNNITEDDADKGVTRRDFVVLGASVPVLSALLSLRNEAHAGKKNYTSGAVRMLSVLWDVVESFIEDGESHEGEDENGSSPGPYVKVGTGIHIENNIEVNVYINKTECIHCQACVLEFVEPDPDDCCNDLPATPATVCPVDSFYME
ncbi:hypothetical protein ACLD02_01950 [Alloalcanivorax sp. C16-2]|uniref:hypothetical protein n=1 Tax=Alloalcanivorax sp. C16-2 TaxID=3390052 RepID=UPI0039710AF0